MTTVKLPSTIDAAVEQLGGLGDLITAKEWSRAAIVWAFTYDTGGGRPKSGEKSSLSISEFAALGLHGLRTRDTVRAYRSCWRRAMDEAGAVDAQPGQRIDLPDLDWKFPPDGGHEKRYTERSPGAFARSLARREVAAEALADDLDDDVAEALVGGLVETRPTIGLATHRMRDLPVVEATKSIPRERRPHIITDADVMHACQVILHALEGQRDGTYQPGAAAALMLTLVRPGDWDDEFANLIAKEA